MLELFVERITLKKICRGEKNAPKIVPIWPDSCTTGTQPKHYICAPLIALPANTNKKNKQKKTYIHKKNTHTLWPKGAVPHTTKKPSSVQTDTRGHGMCAKGASSLRRLDRSNQRNMFRSWFNMTYFGTKWIGLQLKTLKYNFIPFFAASLIETIVASQMLPEHKCF